MILIPETAAERDLVSRRLPALQHLFSGRAVLRIEDPTGQALELGQEPAERLQGLDRRLRRFLLLNPGG